MKINGLLLFVLFSVSISNCSKNVDESKLYGYWGLSIIGDKTEHYIFSFYQVNGKLKASIHSYYGGMKFGSIQCDEVELDGNDISMITNKAADISYEGEVNFDGDIIEGEMIYSNGESRSFNLTRLSDETLEDKFPGLYKLNKKNYSYKTPSKLDDELDVASLIENNIDQNLLAVMVSAIMKGEFGKVNSVLIIRNGRLVFEEYFDGFWLNDMHVLRSATKSISSLLVGIAIDKEFIESVDQPLLDFYPEYSSNLSKDWKNIRLKHVLTMTMGLQWDNEYHDRIWELSDDVIKSTFEQKLTLNPGMNFEYRNPQVDLLAGVLINSTGKSIQEFANENLFEPLGIKHFQWENFKNNNYPLMDGSLCLKPRDMAKVGLMILNNGKWNYRQVISSRWLEESTSFKIRADDLTNYGYLWWIGESRAKPGVKAIFANGLGGQHILIIPQLSTVVVTTGENFDKPPAFLLKMIDQYIISAIH